ncbi:hypothetical protein ACLBWZ_08065 [Brucellaceae bacterium C25G]
MKYSLTAVFLVTQIAFIPQIAFSQPLPPHKTEHAIVDIQPRANPIKKPWFDGKPPVNTGLFLAAELNAVATYIGLEPKQQDVWNSFTTSLINLREPPKQNETLPEYIDVMTLLNREANGAIARGEHAVKLKNALANLEAGLHPDQLEKLQGVLSLAPHLAAKPPFRLTPPSNRGPSEFPPTR